jgi:hypothetical protein
MANFSTVISRADTAADGRNALSEQRVPLFDAI